MLILFEHTWGRGVFLGVSHTKFQTIRALAGVAKNFWALGPRFLGMGIADPYKHVSAPCVIVPNLVGVGQAVWPLICLCWAKALEQSPR